MTAVDAHPDGIPSDAAPGSRWTLCPVLGCGTAWDVTDPAPDASLLSAVFSTGTLAATALGVHRTRVEATLRAHLEAHDVQEWAGTVADLRRRLEAADLALSRPST